MPLVIAVKRVVPGAMVRIARIWRLCVAVRPLGVVVVTVQCSIDCPFGAGLSLGNVAFIVARRKNEHDRSNNGYQGCNGQRGL
jgi:hypothetical protein